MAIIRWEAARPARVPSRERAAFGRDVTRLFGTVFDSRLLLHLWLDREDANLAGARMRLQALAEELVLG